MGAEGKEEGLARDERGRERGMQKDKRYSQFFVIWRNCMNGSKLMSNPKNIVNDSKKEGEESKMSTRGEGEEEEKRERGERYTFQRAN